VVPDELSERLKQPSLRSSVVLPFEQSDGTVAVLNLSSTTREFAEDDLRWASARVGVSPAVDAESSSEALFASEVGNDAQATLAPTSSLSSSSYWEDRTQPPSTSIRPSRSDTSERLIRPSSDFGDPATSESSRRCHRRLRRKRASVVNGVLGKWSVILALLVLLCAGLFLSLWTISGDVALLSGGGKDSSPEQEVDQASVEDVGKVAQDSLPSTDTPRPGGSEAAIPEVSESPSADSSEPAWSETPIPETASRECGGAEAYQYELIIAGEDFFAEATDSPASLSYTGEARC
jgi:hypothetical protein